MKALSSRPFCSYNSQRVSLEDLSVGWRYMTCDTHMREILDPVSPKVLRPGFKSVFRQLQRGKALEAMTFLDGHYLLALDGTEYFSSQTIHCASCLHRLLRIVSITYSHQLLAAA